LLKFIAALLPLLSGQDVFQIANNVGQR